MGEIYFRFMVYFLIVSLDELFANILFDFYIKGDIFLSTKFLLWNLFSKKDYLLFYKNNSRSLALNLISGF